MTNRREYGAAHDGSPSLPLLPLLLSVPHGGVWVPAEVKHRCRLELPDLLNDGDTWSAYLYDLRDRVRAFLRFPVARAVLDVNRAPGDRPPQNPDGVVKTVTVDGKTVWRDPRRLSREQVDEMLERYYHPYHQGLVRAAEDREILLALDCHTMLERAPASSSRPGELRPLVCLSNRGDSSGEPLDGPVTAPPALLRALGAALQERLPGLAAGLITERLLQSPAAGASGKVPGDALPAVCLNYPFRGGQIIKRHGNAGGGSAAQPAGAGSLPWIQVEFNRALYMSGPALTARPDPAAARRLDSLRCILLQALQELFREAPFS